MTPNLSGDVRRQRCSCVIHGQQHARETQSRIEVVANEVDGGKQLTEALQGVILGLDRDQNSVRRGKRVDGKKPDGGRAVEEDEIEVLVERR